jgi:hypothetical protein
LALPPPLPWLPLRLTMVGLEVADITAEDRTTIGRGIISRSTGNGRVGGNKLDNMHIQASVSST